MDRGIFIGSLVYLSILCSACVFRNSSESGAESKNGTGSIADTKDIKSNLSRDSGNIGAVSAIEDSKSLTRGGNEGLNADVYRENVKLREANFKQQAKSLKNAYKNFFPIGAAVLPRDVTDANIASFLKTQYSSLTPANHMKPTYIQPKEGQFVWTNADLIANFAKNNGLKLRGHTLVWPQQMPKWMYQDGNKRASKALLLKRLETHIKTTVSRYKGVAYCWDVVNEAIPYVLDKPLDSRTDLLFEIAGEEYIAKAFEYAHQADPNAKLFYNDNSFEWKAKRDGIFNYLKKLKAKGVPIHGVGLQAHWGSEGVSDAYLQETIDMFASIGLEVQLTELDISIYPKRISGRVVSASALKNRSDAYTASVAKRQADVYERIFAVCRRNKGKVTGVTLWSAYDWDNYLTKKLGKKNYPYLFDHQRRPKEAFHRVVNF